jgi:probable HAF family extracellular repeat protein
MRDLGVDSSYGYGINNKDQVVGAYFPGDGSEHAFYWEGTTGFQDIHNRVGCGGNTSEALDINENDQIVGYCTNADRVAFAYFLDRRTGTYTRLNVPGSRAAAINNKGQVVGHFRDSLLIDHAFVWIPATGEMTDLNDVFISETHWELFYAWDINDAGQIVGQGSHQTDYYNLRGFVMTPDTSTPSLGSFSIDPETIVGGNTAFGTITLTAPAPAGGATVSLSHYYWFVAGIPDTVTVPAGSTTYRFSISTAAVWNAMPIEVKATYRGITRAATFTVTRSW